MVKSMNNMADDGRQAEIISVDLEPKLRYLAEIAARKQRRALPDFIEWAVKEYLLRLFARLPELSKDEYLGAFSIDEILNSCGDGDESDRFVNFAFTFEDSLAADGQILLELIRGSDILWRKDDDQYVDVGNQSEGSEKKILLTDVRYLMIERLREHWDKYKAVVRGEAELSTLSEFFGISTESDSKP
jgi:hypothetical protein